MVSGEAPLYGTTPMDPMKILLVDDSKSARYALRLQLQRHGVEVDTADSAESAFELLKGELPDAILMDHMMPGLNGFEALEVIREDPRTAHLPVVMCTSHEDADFAAAAQRKGVLGILPKSGAPEILPAILAKLRDSIQLPSQTPASLKPPAGPVASQATQPQRAPTAAPSTAPAPGGGIDESQILTRLEARVASRITSLIEDLRRDLNERLAAEAQRRIDTGLKAGQQGLEGRLLETRRGIETQLQEQWRSLEARVADSIQTRVAALGQASQNELRALSEHLDTESLPRLVKVEIEAERGQILALVERYLEELGPRPQKVTGPDTEERAKANEAISARSAEIARIEARAAVEAALSRRPPTHPPDQVPARGLTGIYLAILAAALAGIGAAAAVYILLS